jgi:hypothetical protein
MKSLLYIYVTNILNLRFYIEQYIYMHRHHCSPMLMRACRAGWQNSPALSQLRSRRHASSPSASCAGQRAATLVTASDESQRHRAVWLSAATFERQSRRRRQLQLALIECPITPSCWRGPAIPKSAGSSVPGSTDAPIYQNKPLC